MAEVAAIKRAATDPPASQLEDIAPGSARVMVGEETLVVEPLNMGQWAALLKEAKPLIKVLRETRDAAGTSAESFLAERSFEDWLESLADHTDALFSICSIACGKDAAFISAMKPDAFTELAGSVIRVNRDFFMQRMPQMIARIQSALKNLADSGDG